jgi:hypothetical protein
VVAKFKKCCIFLQHAHDLHFYFVAQGLALWLKKKKHKKKPQSLFIPHVQCLNHLSRQKPWVVGGDDSPLQEQGNRSAEQS